MNLLLANRQFAQVERLNYGDHGIERAVEVISRAIRDNKRIALYADYDVDGTMSCVSWIWFLRAIGFSNFVHYIPCRFKEGYGVNLRAIESLIEEEKAELVITMDTGITANAEAEFCRSRGVEFVCTDHHKIQPEKMPDCIIVNPKLHPDPLYQELCGCGITFVLLRRLAASFSVPQDLWTDLLALAGMATICDVVPLNPINHTLARKGVEGLIKSRRPIFKKLMKACLLERSADEKDVGFRLGPRINAVGRLGHADQVVEAFVSESPDGLIQYMSQCNDERKGIQADILREAIARAADFPGAPILFLGDENWHPGVVGIAASKVAETFWKPTWLFQKADGKGKGSVRSIPGFDVTEAMQSCSELWMKFGGHRAAGGFTFDLHQEEEIREKLSEYASALQRKSSDIWQSRTDFDCFLPTSFLELSLVDALEGLKPFGYGFEEPRFCVEMPVLEVNHYKDKTTGDPKHTAIVTRGVGNQIHKVLFFNEVWDDIRPGQRGRFLVTLSKNVYLGRTSVSLQGVDFDLA